jgi:hypothetical protein
MKAAAVDTGDEIDDEGGDLVVGVSVRGGRAYFAAVRCPDTVLIDDPLDRIAPAAQGEHAAVLANFRDRVSQEFRRLRPRAIGIGFTRKYQQWTAEDAFTRFTLDAAVMLAAVDLNIPCSRVREEDAARAVGLPPNMLAQAASAKLAITRTKYWNDRAWAIAVAIAIAGKYC